MYKQYQNFGEFVQEKREEKQITLRKFADTIGFSAPFWSDVEKDRRNPPEIDKLHLIARILNLTESENAIMTNGGSTSGQVTGSGGSHDHTGSVSGSVGSNGSGAAHNNLQPYITCYFWKRTS